ncbi:NUDIX hydrolase [Candidatus Parcubacteria bacterium]|nr:MAG: NUDIX hydrolase [Candidatus Parcubacteria bacterium]
MRRYLSLIHSGVISATNENALFEIVTEPTEIMAWQKKERRRLSERSEPLSWADIGVILDDPFYIVIRDLVRFPNGHLRGYSRLIGKANVNGGQGVVVFPQFRDRVIVLHQFRHATRQWHYEFPRGYGEPGTSAEENAVIEIRDEIGGQIAELLDLGIMHNNTGLEGHSVSLFLAKLSSIGKPNVNEGIRSVEQLSLVEFEEWIANGKITDGFTIAAYTRAKLRGVI